MITTRNYRTSYSIISLLGLLRSIVRDCPFLWGMHEMLKKEGRQAPPSFNVGLMNPPVSLCEGKSIMPILRCKSLFYL